MATTNDHCHIGAPDEVLGKFNFMKRDPIHNTEKPYRLQYDPGNNFPRTNIDLDERHGITIRNIRHVPAGIFDFDQCGFAVETLSSTLSSDSFDDAKLVKEIYYSEVRDMLQKRFKADSIEIMEHVVRKRDINHPISTGDDYEYLQPTTIVHSDFTPDSALETVEKIFNLNIDDYHRIIAINVWKPLHGPVKDWPLALCDASSVSPDKDLQPADVVMRSGYTESSRVYYNPNQQWYYLSGQLNTEALLFRQYDSQAYRPVIHSGFEDTTSSKESRPRESIETRAFLFYKKSS